ncbi:hypothetical protein ACROYT_G022624 [Oculina patagonica]
MCDLNDKTRSSHPEDMAPVPFSNYMENNLRPFTCNQDSDCGEELVCAPSLKCAVCHPKTTSGQCCSIPFEYYGETYRSCTTADHHRLWCSLDPVYQGSWGDCA